MDRTRLSRLPTGPGVYLFKDAEGELLYVGKAKNLRARVRSYFRSPGEQSPKTRELVRRVREMETIRVASELEALLLEESLIKEHRPRYNIRLKDDKAYPFLKLSRRGERPSVSLTRKVEEDGSRYFGPYPTVGPIRQALDVIRRLYLLREGSAFERTSESAREAEENARQMVDDLLALLSGRPRAIRTRLDEAFREALASLHFERAQQIEEARKGVKMLMRRQRAVEAGGGDYDVVALAEEGGRASAVRFEVRGGRFLDRSGYLWEVPAGRTEASLMEEALTFFYPSEGGSFPRGFPRAILLSHSLPDAAFWEARLRARSGRRVRILLPRKGGKRRMVELSEENARHALAERRAREEAEVGGLDALPP